MAVDDWFRGWAGRHVERHPGAGWCFAGPTFWSDLKAEFARHEVDEPSAEVASGRMGLGGEFPKLVNHHYALMQLIRVVWRECEVRPDDLTPRQRAELDSRGCEDCGGHGWRRVAFDANGRTYFAVKPCACPLGRFFHENNPDLVKVPHRTTRTGEPAPFPKLSRFEAPEPGEA